MLATQPALAPPPHRNRRLFSDHYLDQVLPKTAEWGLGRESAAALLPQVRALYRKFVPSTNEAQTERELVRPVLELLGHHFEVQPALQTAAGTKRPDYVLYRDEEAVGAHKNVVLTEAALRHALAVADAKHWDRPLDQALRVGTDPFTNKNPGYQITFYMQQGGLPWGILTNGRHWRLYHRDTAHKLDVYYEADLPELLESDDPQRFQYFLRFFERGAFEEGPLALGRHLSESASYARSVGEGLRSQVYDALLHVAQGFLDFPRNGLTPEPATLKQIYDHALILLYRLLFVLYAEARGLLPVEESDSYRDVYSLHAIKRSGAASLKMGQHLLPGACTLWPRLTQLFAIIDEGSPPLEVATFNGGLFDPERHPFLEAYAVGDAHLRQAIDMLARVEGEFIDYRDLSERHLGSIYEGLLEFHLQPLAPEADARGPAADAWTVELVTDKGERKASGSYYTPGFITRFMVERAVGPVVDAALQEAAPRGPEAQVHAVLNVNVLDCSMGSGHFLVEATDYLARRLVEADLLPAELRERRDGAPGGAAPPLDELAYWKRRVAQSCIYGVDLNPLAVDLAKLSLWLATAAKDRPLSFLDHHLRPGNALVGARLDELKSAAPAGPKKGSAAARKVRAAEEAGQLTWAADSAFTQSMKLAVDSMWLIEESAAATVADVKAQEKLYETVREAFVRKYGRLADLVTATRFGLAVDPTLWGPLTDYATGRTLAPLPQLRQWLEAAESLAAQHRFFHWELEFPEVFFDRFGRALGDEAGFDVVIGNPPYVRQERLAPLKPYFQQAHADVFHGMADLFVYFFSQGLRLLQQDGRLAYISSNSWLQTAFAEPLRRHVRTTSTVETLVDLGNNRTFTEAPDVCPTVFVIVKTPPPAEHRFGCAVFHRGETPELSASVLDPKTVHVTQHDQPDAGWQLEEDAARHVFAKLMAAGSSLGDVAGGQLLYGIKTGLNEAFFLFQDARDRLVTADPTSAPLIRRLVRGEDLRPWYQEDEGRWLIQLPSGWTRATLGGGLDESQAWEQFQGRHPALADHLGRFAEPARKRQDQGEYWWELRACKYYDEFEKPKLFWPEVGKIPRFSWDEEGKYINNKGFILVADNPALLGVLQSRVTWAVISRICLHNKFRGGLWEYHMQPQFISRLPIPTLTDDERLAVGALAMGITDRARARYALHQEVRHRIRTDLGGQGTGKPLNRKLTAWWELGFPAFRTEVQKVYQRDIPLAERTDWESWLAGRRAEHERLTAEIVTLETELNDRVYRLFGLTAAEIRIIEESTQYRYGEV